VLDLQQSSPESVLLKEIMFATQGGDNPADWKFFQELVTFVSRYGIKSGINLGSGSVFQLEKVIQHSSDDFYMLSVDLAELKNEELPEYVNYMSADITSSNFVSKLESRVFQSVFLTEVIEHIDHVDEALQNVKKILKPKPQASNSAFINQNTESISEYSNQLLFLSFPNLGSLVSRLMLLFGYQPYVLEPSNKFPNAGMGIIGRLNNPAGESIHHIRGYTLKSVHELLFLHGFEVLHCTGYSFIPGWPKKVFTSLAQQILIVARIRESDK
jgi:hypothetical protein